MDFITVPLVLLIIFGTLYKVVKIYATRRERLLYIEKMTTPPPYGAEGAKLPLMLPDWGTTAPSAGRFVALRWALLAMGVGLGILVSVMIVIGINPRVVAEQPWEIADDYGIITGASMFLFGGLGLLISYIIESNHLSKLRRDSNGL